MLYDHAMKCSAAKAVAWSRLLRCRFSSRTVVDRDKTPPPRVSIDMLPCSAAGRHIGAWRLGQCSRVALFSSGSKLCGLEGRKHYRKLDATPEIYLPGGWRDCHGR